MLKPWALMMISQWNIFFSSSNFSHAIFLVFVYSDRSHDKNSAVELVSLSGLNYDSNIFVFHSASIFFFFFLYLMSDDFNQIQLCLIYIFKTVRKLFAFYLIYVEVFVITRAWPKYLRVLSSGFSHTFTMFTTLYRLFRDSRVSRNSPPTNLLLCLSYSHSSH